MVGGFDQPLEHRVGVDLEHSGDRPNAQAFRQRPDRPHEPSRRHTLAMKDGAMGPGWLTKVRRTPSPLLRSVYTFFGEPVGQGG